MKPLIILIGGVPCVGKSTIALEIAHELKIKQLIDLDSIREVLRGERTKKEDPYLFKSSYTSWEISGFQDQSSVINSFENYGATLKKSLKRLIERANVLGKSTIIEGVHIIPSFIKEYLSDDNVELFILSPNNQDTHLKCLNDRQIEFNMNIKEYIDHLDKIKIIDKYLTEDAIKNHCHIIKTGHNNISSVTKQIVELIEKKSNYFTKNITPITCPVTE